MRKYPALILIPHGGYRIPEEFSGITTADNLDIVLSSDPCSNELFSADQFATVLNTHISRLFVDVDRSPLEIPPKTADGVLKSLSMLGSEIWPEDVFPDDIAITGIIKRYYFPYHTALKKILASGEVECVIECHTVHAVGPANAKDRDKPRPIVSVQHCIEKNGSVVECAPLSFARECAGAFEKYLSGEESSLDKPFSVSENAAPGYLMKTHSGTVPWLRINLSRGLILNESDFNYDYGTFNQIRIGELRKKIHASLQRFLEKIF